jgi:ketosteroid isomerase-like protein
MERQNRNVVEHVFAAWQGGRGSFYDLLIDDGSVTIMGRSPNSGTFSKAAFLRDRAGPFQARFTTPILPVDWTIWAAGDTVIARWRSTAVACDGKLYANDYAYFITMRDGRAIALTMFLDMTAFDDVWNRCRPADPGKGDEE